MLDERDQVDVRPVEVELVGAAVGLALLVGALQDRRAGEESRELRTTESRNAGYDAR